MAATLLTTAAITSARPSPSRPAAARSTTAASPTCFRGPITGPGALTVTGAGTVTLSNANDYTGGTTIAAGTLRIGNGGTTGSIAGDVANNGTLLFDRSDTLAFGGMISGSGVAGPGRPRDNRPHRRDASYTGGTSIAAGSLRLGDGGTTGSVVGDVANAGTLVFDRSNALVFDGVISGRGAVVQQGTGTTTLTARQQLYRADQRRGRPAAGRRHDRRRRHRGERGAPGRHRHDRRAGDHRRRRASRARAEPRHADRRLAGAERGLAARLRVLACPTSSAARSTT